MSVPTMRQGLFDDVATQARPDDCRPALQTLAEAVDRYVLGVAGEAPTEATLTDARHQMVAALEEAWDVLRPVPRLRTASGGSDR